MQKKSDKFSSLQSQQESLNAQMLHALADSMRIQAELIDALALAVSGGDDADQLRAADVRRIINCGASKACEIIRTYGTGSGKMGRISRGRLMQLHREGRL